ncbi:unnamed protein product [Paramecium sonneborni]|uniref:ABC transporter domain-containing protein n=1 Tax=Paramecium sonneborni TaxID=65129 RepID=A0A8S1NY97_9CILI|nr:unnamed protein product [Paramecium sonneborni]
MKQMKNLLNNQIRKQLSLIFQNKRLKIQFSIIQKKQIRKLKKCNFFDLILFLGTLQFQQHIPVQVIFLVSDFATKMIMSNQIEFNLNLDVKCNNINKNGNYLININDQILLYILSFLCFQALMNFSVIFQRVSEILKQQINNIITIDQFKTCSKLTSLIIVKRQKQKTQSQRQFNLKINLSQFFKSMFFCNHLNQLRYQTGEIMGIIGNVGAGKPTLLAAILQELPYFKGNIVYQKKLIFGYVEQDLFIYTGTIKENILFGKDYDQVLYLKVLEVSCLDQDILSFRQGDKTEIGEKGTNLSGGQKARLSLARALYSQADLYLFDDPPSAVDLKVAGKIFDSAIQDFILNFNLIIDQLQLKLIKHLYNKYQPSFWLHIIFHMHQNVIMQLFLMVVKNNMKKQILKITSSNTSNTNTDNPVRSLKIKRPSKLIDKVTTQIQKFNKVSTQTLYVTEESNQSDATIQIYKRYFINWKPFILIFVLLCQNVACEIIYNYYDKEMASFNQNTLINNDLIFYNSAILVLFNCCNIHNYKLNSNFQNYRINSLSNKTCDLIR